MGDLPENTTEPANLRFLRILVTILTASMIAGLVTIIILIVIRVPNVIRTVDDPIPLPAEITLPDGSTAAAFTQGGDWYAIITTENEILIFNRVGGELRQTIKIQPR
ncbi:MAG: DUF6476 family protein [Proteobacteria bacterium]|nr:DUF6476 family protein [Pseudomonadota bacterium]